MDTQSFDIAIAGAGPVGSALALTLAAKSSRPERIALLGRRANPLVGSNDQSVDPLDPRTLALNHGSRSLLEQLHAWPARSASILSVHVSQRGRLGRTLIQHDELEVPRLGNVVHYDTLLAALHQAIEQSGVRFIEGDPVRIPGSGQACFVLAQQEVCSRVAIQSDGARPSGIERRYRQEALLATVRASRPKEGWAFERFTAQGPLALLPHPGAAGLYAVVWCCDPDEATRLKGLAPDDFAAALHDTFGDRLGHFQCQGNRYVFPLSMHAGPSLLDARTVAVGNAAQTLHPVAGQGLNLGLRDAAQLGQALSPWLARPESDPSPLLNAYAARRRPDRWVTGGLTDLLPRVFTTRIPLVDHAAGLALLALDLAPALRNPLARQLLYGLRT